MMDSKCFDFRIDDDLDCVRMEDKFVRDVSSPLTLEQQLSLDLIYHEEKDYLKALMGKRRIDMESK